MRTLVGVLLIFGCFFAGRAQTQKALELYNAGNYSQAIVILEQVTRTNKKAADDWNLLGLAYLKNRQIREGRKALQKAVSLNQQNAAYRANLSYAYFLDDNLKKSLKEIQKSLRINSQNAEAFHLRGAIYLSQNKFEEAIADADRALQIKPDSAPARLLKSDSFIYIFGKAVSRGAKAAEKVDLLEKAIEPLESCSPECARNFEPASREEKLNTLKTFYKYYKALDYEAAGQTPPVDNPTITPLKILNTPKANYTDAARQRGIQGRILLAVYFSEDGKNKHILALNPLGKGLAEQALGAARQIRFEPQKKNGVPVSVVKTVEYTFTLY